MDNQSPLRPDIVSNILRVCVCLMIIWEKTHLHYIIVNLIFSAQCLTGLHNVDGGVGEGDGQLQQHSLTAVVFLSVDVCRQVSL